MKLTESHGGQSRRALTESEGQHIEWILEGASMALRELHSSSYENRGVGGGRGYWGCQGIGHFLQTMQSLTPRDEVSLSYACSPLAGATKGNALRRRGSNYHAGS